MKKLVILFSLLFSICHAVTIPRASMRQISASPLVRGETAYVEGEAADEDAVYSGVKHLKRQLVHSASPAMPTSYAEMYIGGESGPLRVIDSSSLRGYKLRTLDSSEYSISAGPLFVHDVAAGTYTMSSAGPTNAIIITAKDGVVIEGVTIQTEFTGVGLIPGEFTHTSETYDGSVYRWECAFARAASLVVSKITVKAMDKGEVRWINDTVETVFMIHDVLGQYNLKDLRNQLLNYYNGNRGEDWSRYKAYKPVRLDGQAVRFTADNRFTMSLSYESNLVFQAAQSDAVEFNVRTSAAISYTTFQITGIDVDSGVPGNPVTLNFTCDIANFNAGNIGVSVCEKLDDGLWMGLPQADYTVSNVSTANGFTTGAVTVARGVRGALRYFKLRYGPAASDVVDIVLHGRVIVKDVFILKGTDSKYYQINVNGGAISATEVTL